MLRAMLRSPALVALLSAVACAPPVLPIDTGNPVDTGKGGDDSAQSSSDPSIRIIYPVSSTTTVYCPSFFIVVDVDNFTIVDIQDDPVDVEGEGHWHLKNDDTYVVAVDKEYLQVPTDKVFSTGTHYVSAQLAQNDHQPLDPNVEYGVEITIGQTQADGVTPCSSGPDDDYEADTATTGDSGWETGY